MTAKGLAVAAPMSRSGKTTVTLGLVRALTRLGHQVQPAKSGPDYIDTSYLGAAAHQPAFNLDAYAMQPERLSASLPTQGHLIVEGAMGLFDGAPPLGKGSVADLAEQLSLPILLVVDCASLAQSVAPLINGFLGHREALNFAGLILNRVGSDRHEAILRRALTASPVPVLGAVRRSEAIHKPSRHLGLVQAAEDPNLNAWLDTLADHISDGCDLEAIEQACAPLTKPGKHTSALPPLGQHIAIARDAAFSFTYHHMLEDWRKAGAALTFFSPLADQPPSPQADAIFLPGGYPELHCETLAQANSFHSAMRAAAAKGVTIYGECGGYMVLGKSIEDTSGASYPMTGLLDLATSFATRKLHLGYRHVTPRGDPFQTRMSAHEFHYATIMHQAGPPLFQAHDAMGTDLGQIGLVTGSVSGSFAHIIDAASE